MQKLTSNQAVKCAVIIAIAIFAVLVLTAVITHAQPKAEVTDLPECGYSSTISVEGDHQGWWVGVDENHIPVCINRLDQFPKK